MTYNNTWVIGPWSVYKLGCSFSIVVTELCNPFIVTICLEWRLFSIPLNALICLFIYFSYMGKCPQQLLEGPHLIRGSPSGNTCWFHRNGERFSNILSTIIWLWRVVNFYSILKNIFKRINLCFVTMRGQRTYSIRSWGWTPFCRKCHYCCVLCLAWRLDAYP